MGTINSIGSYSVVSPYIENMKSFSLLTTLYLGLVLTVIVSASWNGDHFINSRQLFIFDRNNTLNWFQASNICRQNGWNLLTINSAEENLEVTRLGKLYDFDAVWIAASDLGETRRWVWSKKGDEVKEFYWRAEEPSSPREQCIEVIMADYPRNWNDNDCQKAKPFICEDISFEERTLQQSHHRIPHRDVPTTYEITYNPENINVDLSDESTTDIEPIVHLRGPAKEIYTEDFATLIGDSSSATQTTGIQLDPEQLTKTFQKVFALLMKHISAEGGLPACHPEQVPEQPSSFGQAICKLGFTVMKQIDTEEEGQPDEEASKALADAVNGMTVQLMKNVNPEVPDFPKVTAEPEHGPSSGLRNLFEKYKMLSQYQGANTKVKEGDQDEIEDHEDTDDSDEEETFISDVFRAMG